MTVKELIELNQMILDIVIEVRQDGGLLLDYISLGMDAGIKPPYPIRVPRKPEYAKSITNKAVDAYFKDAAYIRKSVNAREDGKGFWETKWNRVPAKYLDLDVYSWCVRSAYRGIDNNKYSEGERIIITALPSGEKFFRPEPVKQEKQEVDENQMTIDQWLGGQND